MDVDFISSWLLIPSFSQEQAKIRMMYREKDSDKTVSYWSNVWGKPKDYRNSGMTDFRVSFPDS